MHESFDERRYLIPFRAMLLPQIFTDVLVIGSGVTGLRAAIAAAERGREVIVTTKGRVDQSNTAWAQGGIAAVLDEQDSFDAHVQDTLAAGAGLCDEQIVRQVVEAAPARIGELIEWGMRFDRRHEGTQARRHEGGRRDGETKRRRDGVGGAEARGELALGREGGHSCHRVVHSDGDATGKELARALIARVKSLSEVRLFDDCFVLDLVTVGGQPARCLGAVTHHPRFGLQVIWARATILTAGGCGQVFRESTNPAVATGDGIAMAYRAGARLADMAFMQFHPTTLYVAGASRSLISEAVRGEGAKLIDRNGYRFMPDYHELAELAPRDVVAKSILRQMARTATSHVYLDCRALGAAGFLKRFPGIYEQLRNFDLDPATQPIPVHPSAHYMIGGVEVDACGRTNLQHLYAGGEVACSGINGANRLASNSLLEGLVYGEIIGRVCGEEMEEREGRPVKVVSDIRLSARGELDLPDVRSSLRSVMWRHVGIEREGNRMADVAEMFDFWARYTLDKIFDDRDGWEVQNLLLVGALITRAARWRCESRGTHYREDHPEPREEFCCHDVWQRGEAEPGVRAQGPGPRAKEEEPRVADSPRP